MAHRGAAEPKKNAMSLTTTAPTVNAPRYATTRSATSLRQTTVVAGLIAAAVTSGVAAAVHAGGVSFEADGEMIPLVGFAQMTFQGTVVGGVVLAVLNRRSRSARRRFLHAAVALTALSCVPSVTWPDDTATKLALVALHVLAAAIVVPALVRHARGGGGRSDAVDGPRWGPSGGGAVRGSDGPAGVVGVARPAPGVPAIRHGRHGGRVIDHTGLAFRNQVEVLQRQADGAARVTGEVPALAGLLAGHDPERTVVHRAPTPVTCGRPSASIVASQQV